MPSYGHVSSQLRSFRKSLLQWYSESKRQLPWRDSRDPYRIWVSEMMLQQTRVAAVLDYYTKFLERFPDVRALAEAKEQEVLAAWSGLGYYRRARAMHGAAKVVVERYEGQFPSAREELENLPGIGRYTSAAISSIAFGVPAAVVDGNVERVLTRIQGKHLRDRNETWNEAERLLDPLRPGDWNQAMMELGATLCSPVQPKCLICPVRKWCKEPGREVRKAQSPRRQKELVFGLAERRGSIYLVQRSKRESLMAGMWELPAVPNPDGAEVLLRMRHSITNSDYRVSVVALQPEEAASGKWVRRSRLDDLAVTGLTRKILRAANLWPADGI